MQGKQRLNEEEHSGVYPVFSAAISVFIPRILSYDDLCEFYIAPLDADDWNKEKGGFEEAETLDQPIRSDISWKGKCRASDHQVWTKQQATLFPVCWHWTICQWYSVIDSPRWSHRSSRRLKDGDSQPKIRPAHGFGISANYHGLLIKLISGQWQRGPFLSRSDVLLWRSSHFCLLMSYDNWTFWLNPSFDGWTLLAAQSIYA